MSCSRQSFNIFNVNSSPYGISYKEWTKRWWKWLIAIPKDRNPALDSTGQFCNTFQPYENVWFLAGTFGGSVKRTCSIPQGKALLFPVINYQSSLKQESQIITESQLEDRCSLQIDDIKDISASIDDVPIDVRKFRIRSGCFEIDMPPNNCLEAQEGSTKIASDGYWLFVDLLPVGQHKLISFGSCLSGKVKIGCIYELLIEK